MRPRATTPDAYTAPRLADAQGPTSGPNWPRLLARDATGAATNWRTYLKRATIETGSR
jgi:hypothetical protein